MLAGGFDISMDGEDRQSGADRFHGAYTGTGGKCIFKSVPRECIRLVVKRALAQ